MWAIMVVWQLMFPRDSLSSMVSLLSLNNTSRNPSLERPEKRPRIPETIHYTRNRNDLSFHINEAHFELHATCDVSRWSEGFMKSGLWKDLQWIYMLHSETHLTILCPKTDHQLPVASQFVSIKLLQMLWNLWKLNENQCVCQKPLYENNSKDVSRPEHWCFWAVDLCMDPRWGFVYSSLVFFFFNLPGTLRAKHGLWGPSSFPTPAKTSSE